MSRGLKTHQRRRVSGKLTPSIARPRLTVSISNKEVTAQVVDIAGKSLVYSTSVGKKLGPGLVAKATAIGTDIAKKAQTKKIKRVVLDRGPRRYHGRIKALADAARAAGLEF